MNVHGLCMILVKPSLRDGLIKIVITDLTRILSPKALQGKL